MTVEEYLATPETVQPHELIDGVLYVRDSPSPSHQAVVAELFLAIRRHLEQTGTGTVWLSPLDVILDEERALVVQPDLFYVSNEQAAIVGDHVLGAPALVIEVLSPRSRRRDIDERLGWFAEYGAKECWLVHQDERRIDVVRFRDERVRDWRSYSRDAVLDSDVLPGIALLVDGVFGGYRG